LKDRNMTKNKLLSDLALAKQRIRELEESELKRRKLDSDLKERIKELECLYSISGILDRQSPLEEVYTEVLDLVRAAFKYPGETCVELIIHNRSYQTRNFSSTRWQLSRPIKIRKVKIGELVVCYLGDDKVRSPFLREELREILSILV
jgi:hypothetical protein